jgi:hypothetical protein
MLLMVMVERCLMTLCGLRGEETELDLSGKKLGPGCAILLAPEMEANGALYQLDISNNQIGGRSAPDGEGWGLWDSDFEGKGARYKHADGTFTTGVQAGLLALTNAIQDMGLGSLSSLTFNGGRG